MLDSLTQRYAPPDELPADADAIVTLGGGIVPPAQFRTDPEVDSVSFGRCLHTAAVYKRLNASPAVIVSGGPSWRLPNGPTVAEVMRDTLVKFGVKKSDVITENEAQTTYENAANVAKILRERKLKKALLITDSRHMPRAVLCFRKQGVEVIPLPSDYSPRDVKPPLVETLVPTSDGLRASHKTFHEWFGMAWYWFHGRI
jgi:uncharacterized SAM-binding protein YcdF (DUF218 family)